MRNTNASSTASQLRVRTHAAFSVVLAYNESTDRIRSKDFFDRLVLDHGELFHFICHLWKFDVLREPQLFEAATRDALGADMIDFAIRQSQELPGVARRWIAHWLPSKQADSGALVMLLGGQPRQAGDTTTVCASLTQMAERVNLQVFCPEVDWPAMDSHCACKLRTHGPGGTAAGCATA